MLYDDIVKAVAKVQSRYRGRDPFLLCKEMGIILLPQAFGLDENAIKGFYLQKCRIKTITYNCDLPAVIQRIIVAHELGHARLHVKNGVHAFHDIGLFDESSQFEKEANLFAAEFLLRDEDVLQTLNADKTFFAAAAELSVPIELLDFKFRVMKWKGYKLIEPPITAQNKFLGTLKIPGNDEINLL